MQTQSKSKPYPAALTQNDISGILTWHKFSGNSLKPS